MTSLMVLASKRFTFNHSKTLEKETNGLTFITNDRIVMTKENWKLIRDQHWNP